MVNNLLDGGTGWNQVLWTPEPGLSETTGLEIKTNSTLSDLGLLRQA